METQQNKDLTMKSLICGIVCTLFFGMSAFAASPTLEELNATIAKAATTKNDLDDVIFRASETRVEKLQRQLRDLQQQLKKQKKPTHPPAPTPKPRQITTYRWETRYRSVPYQVKICTNGYCHYETRYQQQAYSVRVPVTIIKQTVGQSESPRYNPTNGYWYFSVDSEWHKSKTKPTEGLVYNLLDGRHAVVHNGIVKLLPKEASPTPTAEVNRILNLLRPRSDEIFVDYGCGADARFCVAAVKQYGCTAIGIEIDPERAAQARRRVADAGLSSKIRIIEGDALKTNVKADVGVVYLYPETLSKLKPKLTKLNRFAGYMHPVPGLAMYKSNNAYVWQRQQTTQQVSTRPYAIWGGYKYYGRVCTNKHCSMCNDIERQINAWYYR